MTSPPGRHVVLVHGGLYEEVDATAFWGSTGIGIGIRAAGFTVHAPNRPPRPASWEEERDALVAFVTTRLVPPVGIVAASNGCSAALRVAVDRPDIVRRLVLCWPATAGDPRVDAATRRAILAATGSRTADRLLAGQTVRGVLDCELEAVGVPVTIVPSERDDPFHQRVTIDRLVRLLPEVHVTEFTPPALRRDFRDHRSRFIANVAAALS